MTVYMGAILLTELLMLTMALHVLNYPGFAQVEKRWYLITFIAVFLCAGIELIALHFDARGKAFALPLTVLTVIQFAITPMLPVFFAGALGMHRQAAIAAGFFSLHVLAEIVSAPFGWIFYYDSLGTYIRGEYYVVYQAFFLISLVILIICLVIVGTRFKKRDLSTIVMVFVVMVAALLPLLLFKVYTDYLGIGLCASLCFIYYNDLIQENTREKLVDDQKKMYSMQEHTISGMANLIESRDLETGEHVTRTSRYVRTLAECARQDGVYAQELDERFVSSLYMMAPMHDIGKIVVPDHILKKPDKLTEEEFGEMKRHASEGGRVVREVLSGVADEELVALASDVAAYHHERWDGKGYPAGLAGEAIPLSARCMAIVDVFDALISERCYKKPMSKEAAFEIIRQESGTHFDPKLAEVFLKHRGEFDR